MTIEQYKILNEIYIDHTFWRLNEFIDKEVSASDEDKFNDLNTRLTDAGLKIVDKNSDNLQEMYELVCQQKNNLQTMVELLKLQNGL